MSIMDPVEDPPIVRVKEELAGSKIDFDLSQGFPFFSPPPEAISEALSTHEISRYSPDQGLPELISAVVRKLRRENGIKAGEEEVMITPGSNYAFFISVSAVANRGEKVALLTPYYFNHLMSLQMLGIVPYLVPPAQDFRLNAEGVERAIKEGVKAVVLVNPSNPTGINLRREEVKELLDILDGRDVWLISDEAYEHFTYTFPHTSPASINSQNVISLYSISKSFGAGGWRVGYMHHPEELRESLLKAQDTIGICAPTPSQHLARVLLDRYSPAYPLSHRDALVRSMRVFKEVFIALSVDQTGGEGALYLFFHPFDGRSGWEMSRDLARRWGILTVPGEPFGADGWVRISFGNVVEEVALKAAERLLEALKRKR